MWPYKESSWDLPCLLMQDILNTTMDLRDKKDSQWTIIKAPNILPTRTRYESHIYVTAATIINVMIRLGITLAIGYATFLMCVILRRQSNDHCLLMIWSLVDRKGREIWMHYGTEWPKLMSCEKMYCQKQK